MNATPNKTFMQQWLLLLGALIVWFIFDDMDARDVWFFVMVLVGVLTLLAQFVLGYIKAEKDIETNLNISPGILMGVCLGVVGILSVLFFTVNNRLFDHIAGRMIVAVGIAGIAAFLLQASDKKHSIYIHFAVVLLGFGVLHRLFSFIGGIKASAITSAWTEGSHFYQASLFASGRLYGQQLPLPLESPSRALLQAAPFLLGVRNILVHRIWEVLLWISITGCSAVALAKRVKDGLKMPTLWLCLFFFLFFMQGPVYYPMMVSVLPVLFGYDREKPLKTLVFVALGSLWAGISRFEWSLLPALLAAVIYLVEEPLENKKWFSYLRWPVFWSLAGGATAWLSRTLYLRLSGETAQNLSSIFSSTLLWDRLFPNSTFSVGVLLGIVVLCLPMAVLIGHHLKGRSKHVHFLRWLGLFAILAGFLIIGLLKSISLGGGGDLQNMSVFILLWLVFAGHILAGKLSPDDLDTQSNLADAEPVWKTKAFWLALTVVVPVFFSFVGLSKWQFKLDESIEFTLQHIQSDLDEINTQNGEVLFVSQRQLLVFDSIKNIKMVPEFEKSDLMDMAVRSNQAYLSEFYSKLGEYPFKAIVIDSISTQIKDRTDAFSEENNAWINEVLIPILMFYRLEKQYQGGEINLLIPKVETFFQDI